MPEVRVGYCKKHYLVFNKDNKKFHLVHEDGSNKIELKSHDMFHARQEMNKILLPITN